VKDKFSGTSPIYFIAQLNERSRNGMKWDGVGMLVDPNQYPDSPLSISFSHTDLPSSQTTLMIGQLWRVPVCTWYSSSYKLHRVKVVDKKLLSQGKADAKGLELVRDMKVTRCEAKVKRVSRYISNNSVEVGAYGLIDGIELTERKYNGSSSEFGRLRPGTRVLVKAVRLEEECLQGPTYVFPKNGKEMLENANANDRAIVLTSVKAGGLFPVEFRSI